MLEIYGQLSTLSDERKSSMGLTWRSRILGLVSEESINNTKKCVLFENSVLELSCNNLEGEIPVELASLSNLETLAVNANNLNGTIPSTIGNMTMLQRLDVSNNTLTGKIPASVENLTKLIYLDVSHNLLSGPVPTGKHLSLHLKLSKIKFPLGCLSARMILSRNRWVFSTWVCPEQVLEAN